MAESQAVAAEALKKLEDQLTCAVCLDSFKQPKVLNCFHVFCEQCLQRLVVQDREGQLSLRCPTCRRSTLLPPEPAGVSSLQSAFYVHHLFDVQSALEKMKEPKKVQCEKCTKVSRPATSFCRDCGQFVCASCVDVHANWKEMSSHEIVSMDQLQGEVSKYVPPKKMIHFCLKHKDQQLRLYCETCDELICHDCTVRLHKGHQFDLISDTFEAHKNDIVASVEPVKVQKGKVHDKLKGLNNRCTEITNQRDQIEADIHENVRLFIELMKKREAELVSQLDQLVQPKLKNLAAQRDEVETILAQLDSCLSVVAESLKTGSPEEILKMKRGVMKQIENMTAEFNEEALTPCEEADVGMATLPSLADDCGHVGDFYIKKVSADHSYATGKGVEVAMVNKKATAFLYAIDHKDKSYTQHVSKITCQLVSDVDNTVIDGNVRIVKENKYEISYQPSSSGPHHLHIKIEGKHIKGSPFAVVVKRTIDQLGTPIKIITGVNRPWGVAVNKKGEIIVVESGAHRVSIFSPAGEKLRSFGSFGSGQGEFREPRGVAVDDDGHILVTDTINNRIQKFTEDGKFITSVGNKGKGLLQFYIPTGIAIHLLNRMVYVSESCNHRVQILNADLTPHSVFGSMGTDKGQFNFPRGIAFDSTGNVYVSEDRNKTDVQVFSSEGVYLRQFGDNKLNHPHDIAIDSNDTIYICDSGNNQICIFDTNGKLIRSFGSNGTLPGQFEHPFGIAVDKSGLIYVCDQDNGRVQIF